MVAKTSKQLNVWMPPAQRPPGFGTLTVLNKNFIV
jgi:hypothetical protein